MVGTGAPAPITNPQGHIMQMFETNLFTNKPKEKIHFQIRWLEPYMDLPLAKVGALFECCLSYAFHGKISELPEDLALVFKGIKYQIDEDLENDKGKVYIARFFNESESFIKVGVSSNVSKRLNSIKSNCYDFELMGIYKTPEQKDAFKIENRIHKALAGYSYIPLKSFGGQYECFQIDESDLVAKLRYILDEVDSE